MTNYPLEPDRQTMEEVSQQALTMGTPGLHPARTRPGTSGTRSHGGGTKAFVGAMGDVLYVVLG
jgi:hypothetical protein